MKDISKELLNIMKTYNVNTTLAILIWKGEIDVSKYATIQTTNNNEQHNLGTRG